MNKQIECKLFKNKRNNQFSIALPLKKVTRLSDIPDPTKIKITIEEFLK